MNEQYYNNCIDTLSNDIMILEKKITILVNGLHRIATIQKLSKMDRQRVITAIDQICKEVDKIQPEVKNSTEKIQPEVKNNAEN